MTLFNYKFFKKKFIDDIFFNRDNFLNFFYNGHDDLIIFDIGANKGQSIDYFKKLFKNSAIHSFEPETTNFKLLEDKYKKNKNIIINNIAFGSTEESRILNCYSDSAQNSFFKIEKESEAIRYNAHPKVTNCIKQTVNSELVNIQTLDNYILKNNIEKINIVKIDVQGFENEVLLGSNSSLNKNIIDLLIIEISFDGVYGISNSFSNVENILAPNNYILWDISHIYKDLSRGRTCWVDAVYVHKDFITIKQSI